MDLHSQNELLNRIREGDNQAVKELYKYAFRYCASFVLKNQGTEDNAKDMFQVAMLVLIEKLKNKDFKIKHKVTSYLYAITKNQWLNKLRRRNEDRTLPINEDIDKKVLSTENDTEFDELSKKEIEESQFQQISKAISELGERCQKILQLFYFKKMEDSKIGPILNMPPRNLPSERARCIYRIKRKLGIL